jgi:DNA-binding transcriptional MerR regulator
MQRALSIGEAAKRAGVSAQTLRHYDKLGLLRPSEVTAAGYRRYSEDDCARLVSIRALREVGFDLETIGRLLNRQQDPDQAVRMQLEALEAQRRALERRRLVLNAAMDSDPPRQALLARLERKQALARLDRLEREAFLAEHLGWTADDPPASQAVWRAAIFDLPEQMDEAQLEAWLELAELASDESFREALDRQRQPPAGVDQSALLEWQELGQRMFADVMAAVNGHLDRDDDVRALLDTWIEGFARLHSRAPDDEFLRWMLELYESADDPRMTRYWELMCRIKAMPSQAPAHARAMEWLLERLRARLASS